MRFREWITAKWKAAEALAMFVRSFRNWREVWEAYRRCRPLPTLVLRNGMTIQHGPGDDPILLYREIFAGHCYTRGGFYTPRAGDTVIDLGANIGFFAVYLQHVARGVRVHCFEPAGETRARLERNIAANGLGEFVTVYPLAVSDRAGVLTLKGSSLTSHRSIFDRETGTDDGDETVQTVSLAEAVALTGAESIDLLKIDVEGAEIEVVDSGDESVWPRVRRVMVEYHDLFRPGCSTRVAEVLRSQEFDAVETVPDEPDPRLGYVRAWRKG
ncbi:MAG: FkbM family methyltransferase [Isosphaeraceae bacterium]